MIEVDNLPKGWTIAKLGELVITEKGKKPKRVSKDKTEEYSIPYVNIKAFEKNIIDEYTDGAGCVLCEEDDFLMVWDGSRSGYVGKAIKGALGSTLVKIKLPLVNQNLTYYFLKSKFVEINSRAKGVGIPHVDPNLLWNYDFPLAPLNEQKRILAKLEQLLTDLDKGIEYLETTKQQLKVYRHAVIKSAFQGIKVFESLNDIGSWMGGGTPSTQKKEYWNDGNILWASSQDVKSKYINETERKITELAIENSSTKWIKKDSLLFVVRSGILRRIFPIAIAQHDLCVNQDIQTLSLNDNYHTEFVYWYLLGNESDIRHKCAKDGTTVESIDVPKLKKYQIPKANLDTQIKVIQEIESRLSVCDKIEETIESSLQQAEALRLSIIKKAFEGKLVSQEPNDEPAEKLLERIRALRQAQGKQGKGKPEKKEIVKTSKKKVLMNG